MPIDENGQGYSPHTKHKLDDLWRLFGMWLEIAQAVLNKNDWLNDKLVYIDATSGCGHSTVVNPDDTISSVAGSPLIFHTLAKKKRIDSDEYFIDRNQVNLLALMDKISDSRCRFIPGNYEDVLELISFQNPKYQIGLLFIDPNAPEEFDFDSIASFSNRYPRIDILIHLSATAQKRAQKERLQEIIKVLGKEHYLIREPYKEGRKNFHWTYILGTNASKLFKTYKGISFYTLDSPEAKAFFPKLTKTKEELQKELQMSLFGGFNE